MDLRQQRRAPWTRSRNLQHRNAVSALLMKTHSEAGLVRLRLNLTAIKPVGEMDQSVWKRSFDYELVSNFCAPVRP